MLLTSFMHREKTLDVLKGMRMLDEKRQVSGIGETGALALDILGWIIRVWALFTLHLLLDVNSNILTVDF